MFPEVVMRRDWRMRRHLPSRGMAMFCVEAPSRICRNTSTLPVALKSPDTVMTLRDRAPANTSSVC
ncbi:hypothetical protein D3C81_1129170 [compost metagenome]